MRARVSRRFAPTVANALSTPRMRTTAMLITTGTVCAVAGFAATSSAAPCSGLACKDNVGLASAYTYRPSPPSGSAAHCPGNPIDPVNVFWFGSGAFRTINVGNDLSAHGWAHNDEASVTLNLLITLGLAGNVSQAVIDNSFGCITDDRQRATMNFTARDRLHVRLMLTASPTKPGTVHYVVGDAHHDDGHAGGTCKKYTVPFLGIRYAHSAISFNDSRNAIATIWRNMGHTPHFDNWVNTRPLQQCDGTFTKSDGFVAAMPEPAP